MGIAKGQYECCSTYIGNHQFRVTFAAGYDDMGKSPTFYTMTTSDGADADNARAKLYDQRFSTPFGWGKPLDTSRFLLLLMSQVQILQFTKVGSDTIALNIQPQSGNIYYFSEDQFGAGAGTSNTNADMAGTQALHATASSSSPGTAEHSIDYDGATAKITCKGTTRILVLQLQTLLELYFVSRTLLAPSSHGQ